MFESINNTEDGRRVRQIKLYSLFCCAIVVLPFPIMDLYFSYNEMTCQHTQFTAIDLTLYQWLLTDGLTQLFFFMLFFWGFYFEFVILLHIIKAFQHLFVFVWTVVGGVLFWHFSLQDDHCGYNLKMYMWIRLLAGLISTVQMNKNN